MGADADLVRRLTEEGFLKGDVGVVGELIAEDYVDHDPPPGVPGDRDGMLRLVGMISEAFSDVTLDLHELVDTVDGRVVENRAMSGVHSGDAFGLPASGRRVRVRGVDIHRCAGGRIVEHRGAVDMSDLFEKPAGGG